MRPQHERISQSNAAMQQCHPGVLLNSFMLTKLHGKERLQVQTPWKQTQCCQHAICSPSGPYTQCSVCADTLALAAPQQHKTWHFPLAACTSTNASRPVWQTMAVHASTCSIVQVLTGAARLFAQRQRCISGICYWLCLAQSIPFATRSNLCTHATRACS